MFLAEKFATSPMAFLYIVSRPDPGKDIAMISVSNICEIKVNAFILEAGGFQASYDSSEDVNHSFSV